MPASGTPRPELGDRFERVRDGGPRLVGLQARPGHRQLRFAVTEHANRLAEGVVADVEILAEFARRPGVPTVKTRLRGEVEPRGGGDGSGAAWRRAMRGPLHIAGFRLRKHPERRGRIDNVLGPLALVLHRHALGDVDQDRQTALARARAS